MKFSSKLLNYVNSVYYNGYLKTEFYTEFATNFSIGDKVFIVNGNYDSNNLFIEGNYGIGVDGYTILDINKCKIVLDIDWVGTSVYNIDNIDNYIKLHSVASQREFDYINTITSNSYATYSSKFEYGLSNNIIYAATGYSGTSSIIGYNNGVSTSGFYQKQSNTNNWINITSTFSNGSVYFNTTTGITYSLHNNSKIYSLDDIDTNILTFKSNKVYVYNNGWNIDVTYINAYITRVNFRGGNFSGKWDEGVFGSYTDTAIWGDVASIWNDGIILNSNWLGGTLDSKTDNKSNTIIKSNNLIHPSFDQITPTAFNIVTSTPLYSSRDISYNTPVNQTNNTNSLYYYCALNDSGLPIESTDYSNNKGFGFNYIVDSNIESANIINGNFENCNIGLTNYGINSVAVHYGLSFSYNIILNKGHYSFCDINTVAIANSVIDNSNVINSNINTSKLYSNQITNTVATIDYDYVGINILNSDLWSYRISGENRGILKLYISDEDLNKLSNFDSFYIDRLNKELYLNIFNNDAKGYINIENKYTLDVYNNKFLSDNSIVVSLKNKNDNLYISYITTPDGAVFSNNYKLNPYNYASIDIDIDNLAWYDYSNNILYATQSQLKRETVNNLFSNTKICDSDFNSGIALNSNWNGDNANAYANIIRYSSPSVLSITISSTYSIIVDINTNDNSCPLDIGDYIWLSGIDYINTIVVPFSGTFRVDSFSASTLPNSRKIILKEQTNNINSLLPGGYFGVSGVAPNYVSINKFKIDNCTIISGLLKTSLIVNSTVLNSTFNTSDTTLKIGNINILRFVNVLFNNDNNIINSGLIYNSHILNTTWNNGMSLNSILLNATFSNGTFNGGYWINGVFNSGVFLNSDDIALSYPSYDYNRNYKAWRNGIFNNGQFYNSTWIEGIFNNGRLFNSDWYGGTFNNGILGIKNSSSYLNTTMGYYPNLGTGSAVTTFNNGTVEHATIGGISIVNWYDGIFNDGEFTSTANVSTWYGGKFNGGKFNGIARWDGGEFNMGKFLSHYGCTMSSSTYSTDYSWGGGIFKNGQFGSSTYSNNSTWFGGEFSGGNFYGKVWNSGVFTNGNFYGSATISIVDNYKTEYNFVNGFTNSYYGMWRNGYVSELAYDGIPNQKVISPIKKQFKKVLFKNALWLNGTFSHTNGSMDNTVWTGGEFIKGNFNNSSFNPCVDATLNSGTVSFNLSASCVWSGGNLSNSFFYISKWHNGVFNSGTMLGAIWLDGMWNYGTAENIYWQSGTWRNGNWHGTNFDYTTINASMSVSDKIAQSVIYNIANYTGTSSIHLLNAFTGSVSSEILYDGDFSHESSDYNGWTQSGSNNWNYGVNYNRTKWTYVVHSGIGGWAASSLPNGTHSNYQHSGYGATNILYGLTQNGISSFTTSIFGYDAIYNINLNIYINYNTYGYAIDPVFIDVNMGYTASHISCYEGDNLISFQLSAEDALRWTGGANSTFGIYKYPSTYNVTTIITSASVKIDMVYYDASYNNTLYNYSATVSGAISLPPLELTSNGVSINYGNGAFVSGVWENGIWNNGYRNDTTLVMCEFYPTSSYIKYAKNNHRIHLRFVNTIDPNISKYKVGDYVSVGNIVAMDINNNRRLIKDKLRVLANNKSDIVLEFNLNYPILQVIRDSDLHLVYLSKNIWLSGGFLNGYFKGIWNYGLFKGFPMITYMEDTQWIDGNFDGGHFKSKTASSVYSWGGNDISYNTGLIQNFNFKDNNIKTPYQFLYSSWIDVNYTTASMTNIGNSVIYSTQSDIFSFPVAPFKSTTYDLNGYITNDVLASKSTFRKGNSSIVKSYNLGTKFTKYANFIPNNGQFINAFSTTLNPPGVDNFISDGWTFSLTYGASLSYESGVSTNEFYITAYTSPSTHVGIYKLDNTNINILPERYSMVELQISTYSGSANIISSYNKATYSISNNNYINYVNTPDTIKQEFFYNKPDLGLYTILFDSVTTSSIKYPEISYYEIDMIPFFQYTTQSNVDGTIKSPWTSTAPYIDYTNNNYNYIGNIILTVDSDVIESTTLGIYNPSTASNIFAPPATFVPPSSFGVGG